MNHREAILVLRTPESRLFQASWSDGSIDLVGGLALVVIGLGYLTDLVIATALAPPLAFTAWWLLRTRVVEPRAGHAEPRADRRERSTRELGLTVAVGVAALVLALTGVLAVRADVLPGTDLVDGLPAALTAVLTLAAAALTRSLRFVWYAALLAVGAVLTVALGTGPGLPLMVGGGVAAVTGAVLLGTLLARTERAA